jgi:glycosyltransferase involved in cell wall biosynthesis
MNESKTALLNASKAEFSVVIPCLDEADTLGICLEKLKTVSKNENIELEVIVADNGSKDGSQKIAAKHGARIVLVEEKGYGAALMGGIEEARGQFIIMGDADDSYDFLELPKFVQALREGNELVQGCRLPGGGGRVLPGAMPWSHRHLGNPMFTHFVRRWFGSPIHDVYCGMRGFTKELHSRLNMRCTGMEYATEMIIKAAQIGAKTTEVPITLHPDGRVNQSPHLRTIRDGLRTLRFFLLCNPIRLFFFPGLLLIGLGAIGYALAYPGLSFGAVTLDVHTLLASSFALVTGYQGVLFYAMAQAFTGTRGLAGNTTKDSDGKSILALDKALPIASFLLLGGLVLWATAFMQWREVGFAELDYASTMRIVIPGTTLLSLAVETTLFYLFRSWLDIEHK